MESKKIKIDVYVVTGNNTPLIINHPTGVFYTAQCGGIGGTHPEAEGFVIGIDNFLQDFNDCAYGCSYIGQDSELQTRLANALDEYCKIMCEYWGFKIRIDFDRLNEIQEGWFPVIVNGRVSDGFFAENAKGYIHNGNCD